MLHYSIKNFFKKGCANVMQNFAYYSTTDTDRKTPELVTAKHLLSVREICEFYNIKSSNGRYPVKKMKEFLENHLRTKTYYYRPNPKSTFNQKKVYDLGVAVLFFKSEWDLYANKLNKYKKETGK